MYAIEKNVPMPTEVRGNKPKYPWREMAVGDSFVMDKKISYASSHANSAARAIGEGVKFTCRFVDETHTRIWRTA